MGSRATPGGGRGSAAEVTARRRGSGDRRGESGRSGAEWQPEPFTRSLAPRSLTAQRSRFLLSASEAARSGAAHCACPECGRRAGGGARGTGRARAGARVGLSGGGRTRELGQSEPRRFRCSPETPGGGSGLGRAGLDLGAEADAGRGGPVLLRRLFLFLPFPPLPPRVSPPSSSSAPLALPAPLPSSSFHSRSLSPAHLFPPRIFCSPLVGSEVSVACAWPRGAWGPRMGLHAARHWVYPLRRYPFSTSQDPPVWLGQNARVSSACINLSG